MPNVTLPNTLSPKYWDKYKDLPAAQKKKITDALTPLKSKADKADFGALESVKPKNEKEADAVQKMFDQAVKASFDPLCSEAGAAQKVLKALESEAKADKKAPKGLADDLGKAAGDAAAYAKAADAAVAAARKALQTVVDAVKDAAAKDKDKDKPKGGPKQLTPPQRRLRAQAVQTLNLVRKNDPRTAGKLVALIGYVPGQVLRATMGLKVNKSFVQTAVDAALKPKLKWVHAALVWDPKRKLAIFELKSPLQGGLKALKGGLAEQIGVKNVRIGMRKANGEEDLPPDNETDELDKLQAEADQDAAALAEEAPGVDQATFTKRLASMSAEIKQALASAKGAQAKALMAAVNKSVGDKDYDRADALLDEVETLLDSDDAPAASATSGSPAGDASKDATKSGGEDPGELLKALNRAIKDVESGIETFRAEMLRVYADENDQASALASAGKMLDEAKAVCTTHEVQKRLAAVVKNKEDAAQRKAAKASLDEFLALLGSHQVISQLDSNELLPLDVVGKLQAEVKRVQGALG